MHLEKNTINIHLQIYFFFQVPSVSSLYLCLRISHQQARFKGMLYMQSTENYIFIIRWPNIWKMLYEIFQVTNTGKYFPVSLLNRYELFQTEQAKPFDSSLELPKDAKRQISPLAKSVTCFSEFNKKTITILLAYHTSQVSCRWQKNNRQIVEVHKLSVFYREVIEHRGCIITCQCCQLGRHEKALHYQQLSHIKRLLKLSTKICRNVLETNKK